MAREELLYKDAAGNRLLKRRVKSRGVYKVYAKNREGKIIDRPGFDAMMEEATTLKRGMRP